MLATELSWEAPEYQYREKGVSWYWLSIIAAALIIAFSVWEKNFLFGLFVVLGEILLLVWGSRLPQSISFTLTRERIELQNGRSHSLQDFESVSMDALGDGWMEVLFHPRAKLRTPFKVLFPEERLAELRDFLKTALKEIPYEPTFLDAIEKLLRF